MIKLAKILCFFGKHKYGKQRVVGSTGFGIPGKEFDYIVQSCECCHKTLQVFWPPYSDENKDVKFWWKRGR